MRRGCAHRPVFRWAMCRRILQIATRGVRVGVIGPAISSNKLKAKRSEEPGTKHAQAFAIRQSSSPGGWDVKKVKVSALALISAVMTAVTGAAQAVTIDFEGTAVGTYTSLVFGDATITH